MNATLQCLLHVSDLTVYFIDEYPKDQKFLLETNKQVPSGGNISREFFNLVIGVNDNLDYVQGKKNLNQKTNKKSGNFFINFFGLGDSSDDDSSYDRAFAPKDFKRTLGIYNPQFKKFEANDSKDLILYLLRTMHDELNYYGNLNKRLNYSPNYNNMLETFNHFSLNYNMNNFSKISLLFYGTYKNTITCCACKNKLYNFQKFDYISFEMLYYNRNKFNIYDGFRDNSIPIILKGDNQYFCDKCKKLQDAETSRKIFEPPQELLITIDYGKNKKYLQTIVEFDEEIDITKFVDFDYNMKIKYKIIGVCTYF
jgi:ubiquitin C-terminal hydrolase